MNYIDLVIVVIVLWGFWTGMQRGLVRSVTSLLGWLLALVLGSRYAATIAPAMTLLTSDPVVRKIAAFVVIVLAVLLISSLIGRVLRSVLKAMYLGVPERVAGGAFGTAKGLLIVMILIQGLSPWVSESPYWQNSRAVGWLAPFAPVVVEFSKTLAADTWQEVKAQSAEQDGQVQPEPELEVSHQHAERTDGHPVVANPFL